MKTQTRQAIVRQFGHPRGAAGAAAGLVMAHRPSNRRRNEWVAALLDVQPTERVLEIGFGPGLAIAELTRSAAHVCGVDRSHVMLRQATRRNAAAIEAGRVTLAVGSVEQLPAAIEGPFDAILAVNSLAFWPAPVERLAELRGRLAPGGRTAIVSQPRGGHNTTNVAELLEAAGFGRTRTEILDLDPPAICVLASATP
jgi:SAM-dependent methyltransferase